MLTRFICCLLAMSAPLAAAPALAQPLTTAFTFQGELNSVGSPVTGAYDLKFTLFDAPVAGAQVGPQVCADNVAVAAGRFAVQLDFGAQFAGSQRFLEVMVRQDTGLSCANATSFTTLTPRQSLTAAPNAVYSLNAASAATATSATQLNGQPASFYTNAGNLSTGTIPDARLALTIARLNTTQTFTGALTLNSPLNLLSGNGAGLTGLNASSITTGTLVDGLLSTNVALLSGVQTITGAKTFSASTTFNSPVGIGTSGPDNSLHIMKASAGAVTGNTNAPLIIENNANCYLQLLTPNTSESGILFGRVSDNAHGGIIYSSLLNGNGLEFRTSGNTARMYIDGNGNVGIGGAPPFTAKLRVVGTTSLGGNLTVQGLGSFSSGIDAASKAFKIDHPLDPKNKLLSHSCVESPDMMNVYNGNTVTDAQGYATITLPSYFEALNRDFRYQLTVIDESPDLPDFVAARVVKQVAANSFTIKSSVPNLQVSWQVTGIRHDAFAQKHRIQVETDKPPSERGQYRYAEAFDNTTSQATQPHTQPHIQPVAQP